jgi:DNA-directed RNA polymerase subunit omega
LAQLKVVDSWAKLCYTIWLAKVANSSNHIGDPNMIEALLSDEIVEKFGGRFKLTSLIQKRLKEIIEGARPLVERNNRSDLEVVVAEIMEDKITIDWEKSNLPKPSSIKRK